MDGFYLYSNSLKLTKNFQVYIEKKTDQSDVCIRISNRLLKISFWKFLKIIRCFRNKILSNLTEFRESFRSFRITNKNKNNPHSNVTSLVVCFNLKFFQTTMFINTL